MAKVLNIAEIISDPAIRNGRPVINGTTLCVYDVVLAHTTGNKLPPAELADNYQLTLGQVHAALAYYYLHQAAIDAEIQRNAEEAEVYLRELEQQGKLITQ